VTRIGNAAFWDRASQPRLGKRVHQFQCIVFWLLEPKGRAACSCHRHALTYTGETKNRRGGWGFSENWLTPSIVAGLSLDVRAMSPDITNAIASRLLKPQPPLTTEQEFFLKVLRDVGESKRECKLTLIPIQDLCEKQYSLWRQRKAEFEQREAARKLPWPSYRASSELDGALRAILESWAVTNRLTCHGVAADWVVRWATDVFIRWETVPEDRQLFTAPKPHSLPALTLSDPPPEYLMIPMKYPHRKVGEKWIQFSRRVKRTVKDHLASMKNQLVMPTVLPAPPTGSKAQSARSGAKRQYLDHLSLAFRVCGLQLKEIEAVLEDTGPWFVRSQSTISRGAAKVATVIQLDLP
jgi:hypothetical protein